MLIAPGIKSLEGMRMNDQGRMPGEGVPAGMLDAAAESWLMSLLRGETMISVPLIWIGPAPKVQVLIDEAHSGKMGFLALNVVEVPLSR